MTGRDIAVILAILLAAVAIIAPILRSSKPHKGRDPAPGLFCGLGSAAPDLTNAPECRKDRK